jgi:hypothetical protein
MYIAYFNVCSCLDESMRWLVANHRYEKIIRQVNKAARWNKLNAEEVMVQAIAESDMLRQFTGSHSKQSKGNVLHTILEVGVSRL